MIFSNQLIYWYLHNKRNLPWRSTNDPYKIWLSEIVLQQTRVDQGMSYYLKFVKHFPKVQDLASASEEEVLKLWQGLGYYSRARNLHHSAKVIVNEMNAVFPSSYKTLIKLKGIGDYTASAIASICFNEPTAVVDGNVYRLLARYFGITTPINSTKGIKKFKQLAQSVLDIQNPGIHNQAVMEFGARVCKPQNPDCTTCILSESCMALANKSIKLLPVKEQKIKIRKRHFNYIVIHTTDNKTNLVKRTQGIWLNLYEFPLIESENEIDVKELIDHPEFIDLFKNQPLTIHLFNNEQMIHKLSHQHIHAKFWVVKIPQSTHFSMPWKSLEKYPVSTLIDNFLNRYKNN